MNIIYRENSTASMMLKVILATLPAVIVMTYFFGWGVVQNIVLASVFCCLSEAVFVYLRGQSIKSSLSDYSALLTGLLIGLSIPPAFDIQLILLACVFATVLVKQLYGGLGQNIFNPAMMGFVVLLISFPADMSSWAEVDAISGATVLDQYKQSLIQPEAILHFTSLEQSSFFWINLVFLLGGIYLLLARVITWHLPISFLFGICVCSGGLYLLDMKTALSPLEQLFSGAVMIGAFFIVTDPVSGATSRKGQLIYGVSVGLLVIIIRQWSVYPDGVAFAVLLMNMVVPVIDYYTRPSVDAKTGN